MNRRQVLALAALPAVSVVAASCAKPGRTTVPTNGEPWSGWRFVEIVKDGKTGEATLEGRWRRGDDGWLTGSGRGAAIHCAPIVGVRSFHFFARLRISELQRGGCAFVFAGNAFDFGDGDGRLCLKGPETDGRTVEVANAGDLLSDGREFVFSVVKDGPLAVFRINDTPLTHHNVKDRDFGRIGFRPGRATLSVRDFILEPIGE